MNAFTGVINPYALAELVAGKSIRWDSLPDPKKMLSTILNIDETKIFDIRYPILSPAAQVDDNGRVHVLSAADAKARLDAFMNERTPRAANTRLADGLRLPEFADKRIFEILASTAATLVSQNTPWTPADREWIDKGDYFEDVAEVNDPIQGALGDCYYIAALSSVAWSRPYVIINMVRPSGWNNEESPIHQVTFYKEGVGSPQTIEVSEKVPVTKTSNLWVYARSLDTSETWPAIMEKAYTKWRTGNVTDFPNYPAIAGGDPVMACAELIRGTRTYKAHSTTSSDELWNFVRVNSSGSRTVNPMVAWTYGTPPAGVNYSNANVVSNHAYSVLGWDYSGNEKYIVLRNPWGVHPATLDTRTGTWSATHPSFLAPVPLNTNGVFSIKAATYKQYFAGTGVAV